MRRYQASVQESDQIDRIGDILGTVALALLFLAVLHVPILL